MNQFIAENGGTMIMMVLMFGPLYLMCLTSYRQDFSKPVKKADVVETKEISFDDIPSAVRSRLIAKGEKK